MTNSVRRRDAAATRSQLLRAAARRFAQVGYDRTSLRAVASDVGVTAALVIRYFGSKQSLFAEAISQAPEVGALLGEPLPTLGRVLVRNTLDVTRHENGSGLLTMAHSRSSDSAVERLRRELMEEFAGTLAARLKGPDADRRAGLVAAQLIGLALVAELAEVVYNSPLDMERTIDLYAPLVQRLITPEPTHPGGTRVARRQTP